MQISVLIAVRLRLSSSNFVCLIHVLGPLKFSFKTQTLLWLGIYLPEPKRQPFRCLDDQK